MTTTTVPAPASVVRPAPLSRYALGVVLTVLAILSQYFVPQAVPATRILYSNLPGDLFVVYGIPVLAFSLLVGGAPLRNWKDRMGTAAWEGLQWYGILSLLAFVVVIALGIVYTILDPGALRLLERPNPALQQAQSNPWFYVGFSFVIGAFEETIFRGWIFGYWRDRPGNWLVPATWTSAVFAGVHLYYGTTYGAAAPLIFPTLFLTGFAFAATYQYSGGNLVVPALLHGAYDASAFLTIVPQPWGVLAGNAIRYGLIGIGALIWLADYLRKQSKASTPPAYFGGPP